MGGRALADLGVQRIPTAEAISFGESLRQQMGVTPIPILPDKVDCGDIDVLVPHGVDPNKLLAADCLRRSNGGVVSAALHWRDYLVQVDFIPTAEGENGLRHALAYYTYDAGMYLGQLAAWYGLTFATEGLRLRADPGLPWSDDILFETDPVKTFGFLGYGTPPLVRTREDLWRYVLSSPRSHPRIFAVDELNARNRLRNSHRPLWVEFQEWLRTGGGSSSPLPKRALVERYTGEQALRDVAVRYPHVPGDREWQRYRHEKNKENNLLLGMGAVRFHDPNADAREAGEVVRLLQEYLPPKDARQRIMADDGPSRENLIQLARDKAGKLLRQLREKRKE